MAAEADTCIFGSSVRITPAWEPTISTTSMKEAVLEACAWLTRNNSDKLGAFVKLILDIIRHAVDMGQEYILIFNQVLKGYLALFQTSQANHQLSCLWDIVFSQKLHQVETVLMEYESGAHPACIRSGGRDTTLGSLLFSSYARAHSNGLGVQQETVKAAGVCMGRGIRADAACESQTSSCGSGDSNSGLAIRGGLSEDDLMDVDCEECRGPAADQGSCPQTDDDGAREQQPSQASPSFSKYGVVGVSTGDQYGQTLPEETNETGKEPEVSTGTTGLTGDGYSRARTSTPRATMGVDKSTPAASTCPADDEGNQDGQASSEPSMSEVLQDHTSRSPATDTIGADDSVHTPGTVCTVSIPGGSNNRRVSTRIRMRKRQDTSPGPAGGACSGGGSTGKGATKSDKQSGAGRRETRSQRKRPVGTKATLSRDSCAKSQQNAGPEHTLPAFPFDISINTLKGEVDQLAYRVFTRLCSAMIRNKDGRAITTGAISKDQAFEYTRTVLMEFIGGVPERIKRIQDEAYKHRHLSIATKPDGDTTLDSIKARVRSVILSDLSFDKGLKGLEYFLNVFRLAEHIQEIESRLGKPGGLLDPVDQTKLRYTAETSPEDLTYAVADFVLNSGHYPGGSYPRCHLDNLKIVLEFYKWGRGAALFIPIQCRRLRDKLGMPITSLRDVLKIFDEEDQGTIIQPLATMIDKYIIQKILSQAEPSGWGALIATDLETAPGNIHDMLETAYQKPA